MAALLAVSTPRRTAGQSAPTTSNSTAPVWKAWGSVALGPATANGSGRLGGDLALWVTRDRLAVGIHDAAASRFLETGDVYDVSVLAGIHPTLNPHSDFVAGVGAGISRGHGSAGENLGTMPVITAGANFTFNYRVIGIGVDGFAAAGSSRWYYGGGLALAFGWFR